MKSNGKASPAGDVSQFFAILLRLAAQGSDFKRIADHICAQSPSSSTLCTAFQDLRDPVFTPFIISLLERLDCGLETFADLLDERNGPSNQIIWYPWNISNTYQNLPIGQIGKAVGHILARRWARDRGRHFFTSFPA